jgi:hypothetical protein
LLVLSRLVAEDQAQAAGFVSDHLAGFQLSTCGVVVVDGWNDGGYELEEKKHVLGHGHTGLHGLLQVCVCVCVCVWYFHK